jgi:hypothetical protein
MKKLMCFLVLAMTFYSSVMAEEINIPYIEVFGTAITEIIPDKMICEERGTTLKIKNHS